jgi:hypothetical protein
VQNKKSKLQNKNQESLIIRICASGPPERFGRGKCSHVDILLFPVKLGPPDRFMPGLLLAAAVVSTGCGYHSTLDRAPEQRLTVVAAPFRTPHAEAVQEALNGAREELARAESLGSGGFPRLVVEVVRVDELPAGIQALPGQTPLGRGSDFGVTARAWVEEREGSPASRDTGDVRRVETVAQGADSVSSALAATDAIRASARQVGRALALRVLGIPEPSIEPM